MYYVLLGSRPDPAWFPPGLGGSAAWGGEGVGFPGPQVSGSQVPWPPGPWGHVPCSEFFIYEARRGSWQL